jgi:hypothetical protein
VEQGSKPISNAQQMIKRQSDSTRAEVCGVLDGPDRGVRRHIHSHVRTILKTIQTTSSNDKARSTPRPNDTPRLRDGAESGERAWRIESNSGGFGMYSPPIYEIVAPALNVTPQAFVVP